MNVEKVETSYTNASGRLDRIIFLRADEGQPSIYKFKSMWFLGTGPANLTKSGRESSLKAALGETTHH